MFERTLDACSCYLFIFWYGLVLTDNERWHSQVDFGSMSTIISQMAHLFTKGRYLSTLEFV